MNAPCLQIGTSHCDVSLNHLAIYFGYSVGAYPQGHADLAVVPTGHQKRSIRLSHDWWPSRRQDDGPGANLLCNREYRSRHRLLSIFLQRIHTTFHVLYLVFGISTEWVGKSGRSQKEGPLDTANPITNYTPPSYTPYRCLSLLLSFRKGKEGCFRWKRRKEVDHPQSLRPSFQGGQKAWKSVSS